MRTRTAALDAALRVDRAVGAMVTTAVRAKHRRRLARLGNPALEAPAGGWAGGDRRRATGTR